jgi:hypothetical protein
MKSDLADRAALVVRRHLAKRADDLAIVCADTAQELWFAVEARIALERALRDGELELPGACTELERSKVDLSIFREDPEIPHLGLELKILWNSRKGNSHWVKRCDDLWTTVCTPKRHTVRSQVAASGSLFGLALEVYKTYRPGTRARYDPAPFPQEEWRRTVKEYLERPYRSVRAEVRVVGDEIPLRHDWLELASARLLLLSPA